ncbi:MAG TPA: adenylate/guanylate cyclase domain-containing protein [Polyangiaceae bacterium]|nr:adenylate/guanylate cyclase domain-containing protein [Polyangiaceae bacterium]
MLTTPEGQQVVELRAHNTLGRHPSNTIQLLDKIVSKEHCIITQQDGVFILHDLGSLNGTYVNSERVNGQRTLAHGDEIALGSTRGRFEATPTLAQVSYPPSTVAAQQRSSGTAQLPGVPAMSVAPAGAAQAAVANTGTFSNSGFSTAATPTHGYGASQAWEKAGLPSYPTPINGIPPAGVTQPIRAALDQVPGRRLNQTRVDMSDEGRAIGNQIDATARSFLPYEQLAKNPQQLAQDYERLRLSHELSRDIALERDLPGLLNKILVSVFRFIRADRGIIFLKDETGNLIPGATLRRDGSSDSVTVSSTILEHVMKERATVLTHNAAMDFAGAKGKSMILNRISSAIVAPLLHNDELLGVLWLDSETLAQFQAKDLEMVTAIAAQAAMFIEINILGRKIEQEVVARERFSRLLSPNVAEKVLSGEMVIKRGGQLVRNCTVYNSDIRGFTQMSEGADPEGIVEMLNDYFELMVESIFKFEGTLDKFMGDGIMALWGAPVVHPDDAYRAVSSAIDQLQLLEEFNAQRYAKSGANPLSIGVGIHTGKLVAGYIGSSRALSYTVIGDTANTSARLCGIAGPGQILVSEETLANLGGRFANKELPPAHLKGKERPFRIFEIQKPGTAVQVAESVGSQNQSAGKPGA